jgi:uncharacterized protein YjdB
LTVTGTYDDDSSATLSEGVLFASGDDAIATVTSTGDVDAVAAGSTTITATVGELSATAQITVNEEMMVVDPVLVSLSVSPASSSLESGETVALMVTGTYDDDSSESLSDGVTYVSSDELAATVDATGLVTAVAAGSASVTATYEGVSGSAEVVVEDPAVPFGVLFDDDYGPGISFLPFGGSENDVSVDDDRANSGIASLKIVVPASGYTGGAFKLDTPQDLSGFNAITFYAKASETKSLNVVGLGNNSEDVTFIAEYAAVPLTSEWTQFVVPIPLASKLTSVDGVFHFAEGSDEGAYTIWLDDITYTTVPEITAPSPAIATESISVEQGAQFAINGTSVTFDVGGTMQTVSAAGAYFDFTSSDEAVATVDASGLGTAVGLGTTDVTASLGGQAAAGTLTVDVTQAMEPSQGAPAPTQADADVVSLYSNAYTDVTVDTWSAGWDQADVQDVQVSGDDTKKYTNLNFAGIEFAATPVDASAMTHFHLDIWTADSTVFKVKLVDFGADGAYGGGDDSEHELTFDAASTPALVNGQWWNLDIPFSDFAGLANRASLAQLILVGSTSTVFVDNVYFWR